MTTRELLPDTMIASANWSGCNERGIQHAEAGDWTEAAQHFQLAQQLVGNSSDASDDALALLLSNATTALFNAGDVNAAFDAAMSNAELRAKLWGNSARATLRAKFDLATIQCAMGRHQEARTTIDELLVVAGRTEDADSEQLIPLVENAARIALAAGDVGAAEPHVLRLFSLLDTNGQPTTSAERLFRMIASARSESTVRDLGSTDTLAFEEPLAEGDFVNEEPLAHAEIGVEKLEVGDTEPEQLMVAETLDLQAAVAEAEAVVGAEVVVEEVVVEEGVDEEVVVDVLPAVEAEVVIETVASVEAEGSVDAVDETHADDAVTVIEEPAVATAAADSPLDALELVTPPDGANSHAPGDIASLTSLELVEPAPPTLNAVPEHRRHVHRDDEALGFLVQHGTTVTPDDPIDVLGGPIGPLPKLARPVEVPPRPPAPEEPAAAPLTPPGRAMPLRRSSRDMPVVVPTPTRMPSLTPMGRGADGARKGNTLQYPAPKGSEAKSVLLDHQRVRSSGGARVWLVVGGGLAAVAAAVAWYLI